MEKKKTKVIKSKPKKDSKNIWLSPSLWGVWRKCALSVQSMPAGLKVESDSYAREGTDLHAAIAKLLEKKCAAFSNDEDEAIARFACETTLALADNGNFTHPIAVEHFMKEKFGSFTIGGTADCLIDAKDTIIVIDHKTGWKEVEAEGNEQLKIYAHLAAKEIKKIKTWKGVIINARFNSTSYVGGDIEPNYLKSVVDDVNKRLKAKQHLTGYHCAYCPRLTTCTHIRKAILDWMTPGAIDGLTRNPEKLGEVLRLAKPAEKLFDTVKKEAQLYIDLGGKIPGISIEYSAGNRVFPSDLSLFGIAQKLGMSVDQVTDLKLITPTEALRRGADKDKVNAIVIRPPRKGFKFN
jgi:hypothetical protein